MRAALPLLALLLLACKGEPPAPTIASSTPPVLSVASVTPSPPPTATASTAPEPAVVFPSEVAIEKLLAEYKDNEVRADGQFKGKLIRTFGTVGQVSKDLTGGIYVTVGTGAQLEHPVVQCLVGEGEANAASALSRGGKVTVQGRVGGLMHNILVRDCAINPLAKFCEKLRVAVNGDRCTRSPKTGDANGIILWEKGHDGAVGNLDCIASGDDSPDDYQKLLDLLAKESKPQTIYGSPRRLCFGVFSMTLGKKEQGLAEDLRPKVQAFFDAL